MKTATELLALLDPERIHSSVADPSHQAAAGAVALMALVEQAKRIADLLDAVAARFVDEERPLKVAVTGGTISISGTVHALTEHP